MKPCVDQNRRDPRSSRAVSRRRAIRRPFTGPPGLRPCPTPACVPPVYRSFNLVSPSLAAWHEEGEGFHAAERHLGSVSSLTVWCRRHRQRRRISCACCGFLLAEAECGRCGERVTSGMLIWDGDLRPGMVSLPGACQGRSGCPHHRLHPAGRRVGCGVGGFGLRSVGSQARVRRGKHLLSSPGSILSEAAAACVRRGN